MKKPKIKILKRLPLTIKLIIAPKLTMKTRVFLVKKKGQGFTFFISKYSNLDN